MAHSDNSANASSGNKTTLKQIEAIEHDLGNHVQNMSEKSPYTDAKIISLEVGPDAVHFYIHYSKLRQSSILAGRADAKEAEQQTVSLPDLDEAAAHTLIEFLYTGKYQDLNTHVHAGPDLALNYKVGTCVYCAAIRYKLPELAELAKEKIISVGEQVDIFEILAVAKDHAFRLLPDDEAWYPAYLEGAVNTAIAENPEPFRGPDFIVRIGSNTKLLQVVWKTVMDNYARAPVASTIGEDETVTLADETVPESPEDKEIPELISTYEPTSVQEPHDISYSEPEPVEELAATPTELDDAPIENKGDATIESETTQEDSLDLGDIEPTTETPQALEQFTDELGFGMSKTYKQLGRASDAGVVTGLVTENSRKPDPVRSDSVMQVERTVSTSDVDTTQGDVGEPGETRPDGEAGEAGEVGDDAQATYGTSGGTSGVKKHRKQKKKKSSIVF